MNIIKLKSFFFSLMAVVMATVFLSSCEKEGLDDNSNSISELENKQFFDLPDEFNNFSSEELKIHLENLSEVELQTLLSKPTLDKIEERSCTNWKVIASTPAECGHCFWILYRRWCGPQSYGGYDYSLKHVKY